ncbi:MAG: anti-sigma factor antagonist [Thermaerobacterales bacterium]
MQIIDERAGMTYVVRLTGELDEMTAQAFKDRVDAAIDDGVEHLVVVLTNLAFIDSSGLGVLIGRYRRIARQGGRISLIKPRPHIRALLDMSGIPNLMPVFQSERQALTGS